jgi:para-nitrobenzyl esterase
MLFNLMDPALATADDASLVARLHRWTDRDGESLVAAYRAGRPDATSADLWTAMASDAVFRMPMIALLEAQSAHAEVYSYLFTWATPAFGGMLRSCHAVEIPFVFENLDQPGVSMFLGSNPPQREVAEPMHQAWLAFARTGKPAHDMIPAWEPYDVERRATMRIDTTWELEDDPYGAERKLWQ